MLSRRLTLPRRRKDDQTVALRGSKSRNKVSVGEPAEGSLKVSPSHDANFNLNPRVTRTYVRVPRTARLPAFSCQVVVDWRCYTQRTVSDDCPGSRLGAVNGVKISHLPTGVLAVLSSSPFPFPGMAVGNPVKRCFFSNNRTLNRSDNPNTQPCSGSIGLGVDEERS